MKIYIETYGCRMNICDSEVILSILLQEGHTHCTDICQSDAIILNCCSVREVGHEKSFKRLIEIQSSGFANKILVIAGCFATQLDKTFFNEFPYVDIVIGPDSYRKLPQLLLADKNSHIIVNDKVPGEMYSDIIPQRDIEDDTTAAVTIMKGCNQYCSYCIEPYTRGGEQSRDPKSILCECQRIMLAGYKELTFVGHIIDRYKYGFAELLDETATLCTGIRIKYLSSHPITYSDKILDVVRRHDNIMRVVHLPLQSGSNKILKRMNRGYTVEQYKNRYMSIKEALPEMRIITDIMVGFCGETEEDFQDTVKIIRELEFDDINVFCFSMRAGTAAAQKYRDNVSDNTKELRMQEIIALRDDIKLQKHLRSIGKEVSIIKEGRWYKDQNYSFGRDKYLRTCVFKEDNDITINSEVKLKVINATSECLICTCI